MSVDLHSQAGVEVVRIPLQQHPEVRAFQSRRCDRGDQLVQGAVGFAEQHVLYEIEPARDRGSEEGLLIAEMAIQRWPGQADLHRDRTERDAVIAATMKLPCGDQHKLTAPFVGAHSGNADTVIGDDHRHSLADLTHSDRYEFRPAQLGLANIH